MNNYNQIQQRMIHHGESNKIIGTHVQSESSAKKAKKMNGLGFLYESKHTKLAKKRNHDEMEKTHEELKKEGSFKYKYQSGHTKNIRREIPFSFFM